MSEVIREFIKGNANLPESDAFERFLRQDRIKAWVGDSAERREKLHREFARVWATHHAEVAGLPGEKPIVTVRAPPPATHPEMPTRRLHVMCPNCNHLEVWTKGHLIECRSCGRHYDNMLDLIPVKPVGPFAFIFGEGVGGLATAAGVIVLLLILYGVFRWA